jgi:hypothetical protein
MSYLTFVIYCVVQLLMAYFGYLDVAMQLYVYYIYIYICEWQNDVYRVGYFNLSTQDANTLAFNWT